MPSSDSSRDALLERLTEEFVERHRRGDQPAIAEYAAAIRNSPPTSANCSRR